MRYHNNYPKQISKHFFKILAISIIGVFICSCNLKEKIIKIGIANTVPDLEYAVNGFKQGMKALGYHEGKNIMYLYEGPAQSIDKVGPYVKQLIAKQPDLIVTFGNPCSMVTSKLTKGTDISVILAVSEKPVEHGMIQSFKNPGGNVTGIHQTGFIVKTFEWLHRVVPDMKFLYIPHNPKDISAQHMVKQLQQAAKAKNIILIIEEAENLEQMKRVVTEIPKKADAAFMNASTLVLRAKKEFIAAAIKRKIPFASATYGSITDGCLLGFGFDLENCGKYAARITDRVIKGESPGKIPVENIEFYLGINLNTAQIMNVAVPELVLNRADKIIKSAL